MASIKNTKTLNKFNNLRNIGLLFMWVGGVLFVSGVLIIGITFYPVAQQEIAYASLAKKQGIIQKVPSPINPAFSIMIPKIGANVAIVANVDPYNETEYQQALTKGVAHAQGTVYPGQPGNTFLFAHSATDWWKATTYNAVFYLLYKLSKGDILYTSYKGTIYAYKVSEVKEVADTDIQYLTTIPGTQKTITLMTCWPPGTTLKRLIVVAEMIQ